MKLIKTSYLLLFADKIISRLEGVEQAKPGGECAKNDKEKI